MLSFKRKVSTFFDNEPKSYGRREFEYSQESMISQVDEQEPPSYISNANKWVSSYPEKEKRNKGFSIFERSEPVSRNIQDFNQRSNIEPRSLSMHRLMEEDQWSCEGVFHSEEEEAVGKPWYSKLRNTLTPPKTLRLPQRPPAYAEMKDCMIEETGVPKSRNKFQSIKGLGKFGRKN
ncbi:hypothetical protein K7432_007917 [Basidiobolus ranarum]|uniref:Uncharacterized protein n=1 Tax=Basidiobolus ranarum TaxID=34480 RepID=A0ABR2WSM6_9FUNG